MNQRVWGGIFYRPASNTLVSLPSSYHRPRCVSLMMNSRPTAVINMVASFLCKGASERSRCRERAFRFWKSERSVLLVIAVTIWPLAPNAAEAEYPDLDLNQGLDLRRVQCYPLHHRDRYCCQYPGLESNQDQDLRSVLCCPLHHRDIRADDWICTSIIRFTRPAPCYVEPRRQYQKGVTDGS